MVKAPARLTKHVSKYDSEGFTERTNASRIPMFWASKVNARPWSSEYSVLLGVFPPSDTAQPVFKLILLWWSIRRSNLFSRDAVSLVLWRNFLISAELIAKTAPFLSKASVVFDPAG